MPRLSLSLLSLDRLLAAFSASFLLASPLSFKAASLRLIFASLHKDTAFATRAPAATQAPPPPAAIILHSPFHAFHYLLCFAFADAHATRRRQLLLLIR